MITPTDLTEEQLAELDSLHTASGRTDAQPSIQIGAPPEQLVQRLDAGDGEDSTLYAIAGVQFAYRIGEQVMLVNLPPWMSSQQAQLAVTVLGAAADDIEKLAAEDESAAPAQPEPSAPQSEGCKQFVSEQGDTCDALLPCAAHPAPPEGMQGNNSFKEEANGAGQGRVRSEGLQ